jgi:hypothetical protein
VGEGVGLRSPGLRTVAADDLTVVLRLLVDRRDELGRARTEVVSRIHHLLLELIPGGAKKFLTRGQASYLPRTAGLLGTLGTRPAGPPDRGPRPTWVWIAVGLITTFVLVGIGAAPILRRRWRKRRRETSSYLQRTAR